MDEYHFIRARVRFLTTAEGGRKSPLAVAEPFTYRPNSVPESGGPLQYATHFTEAVGTVVPSETIETELILFYAPEETYAAFVPGARFGVYEGTRNVAVGVVLSRFTRSNSEWKLIYQQRSRQAGKPDR